MKIHWPFVRASRLRAVQAKLEVAETESSDAADGAAGWRNVAITMARRLGGRRVFLKEDMVEQARQFNIQIDRAPEGHRVPGYFVTVARKDVTGS